MKRDGAASRTNRSGKASGEAEHDDDHREAVQRIARELSPHGLRLMALGSTALLLRTGSVGRTKDVDLHAFPIQHFTDYLEKVEQAANALGGNAILEADGASITLNIHVRGKPMTIELIEGNDEWISPEILADAVQTPDPHHDILLPSWEHFIAMKAEAHHDRIGPEKQKYLSDLTLIQTRLEERNVTLRRKELERVIRMRHPRKHAPMLATVFRIFERAIRSAR